MNPTEKVEEGWINARLIIEAQGKPEKHVLNNLKAIHDQIVTLPDVDVYDVKNEPANEVKDGFVSALMDLGIVVKDADLLMQLVLNYGPSAVIIIEPEEIKIDFRELQNILNDVTNFLHTISQQNMTLRLQNHIAAQKLATKK